MKVSEIMTKEVITVSRETSLKEAAGLLAKFRVHALPVVDESDKVIGIVAESDFFTKDSSNIFLPTFLDFVGERGKNTIAESGLSGIGEKTKIEDIMTTDCFTVNSEMEVEELIRYIQEKNFNSMPVVDGQNVLIGIVSIMDVIKLL